MSTRCIPPETREKLARLVPRLASTFEGERVATVAAIERVLAAEGCDWHDLVGAIQSPEAQLSAPGHPPSRSYGDAACEYLTASALVLIIEQIETGGRDRLNDRSREFLRDMHNRSRRFDPVRLSYKQRKWLEDLARQVGAAA
jgi:hypothetical protein